MHILGSCTAADNECEGDRTDPGANSLCAGCMDPAFTTDGTTDATDCNNGLNVTVDVLPTPSPAAGPTSSPIPAPSLSPTNPTAPPTNKPTPKPTDTPTNRPTTQPTSPTSQPTDVPVAPTASPIGPPTASPTLRPTSAPVPPTKNPTDVPTKVPTPGPTSDPNGIIITNRENVGLYWYSCVLSNVNADYTVDALYLSNDGGATWSNTGAQQTWNPYPWVFNSLNGLAQPWDVKIVSTGGDVIIAYDVIDSLGNYDEFAVGQNFGVKFKLSIHCL